MNVLNNPMKLLKEYIKILLSEPNYINKKRNLKRTMGEKRIFLLGTPVHGNLGDHAIAIAEEYFFKHFFSERIMFDFTMPFCNVFLHMIKKYATDQDVLFISGGGWLGSLWKHNEYFVRKVISYFPNNIIVILPQTIYFEMEEKAFLEEGKAVYQNHQKLIFCVREKNSFDMINETNYVKNKSDVLLMPDMVFYLKRRRQILSGRNGILLCFRDDIEQQMEHCIEEELIQYLQKNGISYKKTSTILKGIQPVKWRKKIVCDKLNEFSSAQLIITDRLHAMLFAAITDTPCICFDNKTHKVAGVYEWLRPLDYIGLISAQESLTDIVERMLKKTYYNHFSDLEYISYLEKIKMLIMKKEENING